MPIHPPARTGRAGKSRSLHHTLVTILGRSRESADTGYRRTVYRFPDGTEDVTAFFGLALARHLESEAVVILGTRGSQWGVLVEHLAAEDRDEAARLELIDAEAAGEVDQRLLDRVEPLLAQAVGRRVIPRLIPFGLDAGEQYDVLGAVADAVPNGDVSFDLTHGFRHLGMIGLLSAFMLEGIRNLTVRGLWYGALDMTRDGVTPVLRLDGLDRVRRWVGALDRFDATGDYGVFAPLLIEDGVPEDKASCLKDAAFYERTLDVRNAARRIRTFLPVLDETLTGAAGLFRRRLAERLRWADAPGFAEQQRKLAHQYLNRGDFVRAAMFGREACVTRVCEERGVSTVEYSTGRQEAVKTFESELQEGRRAEERALAWWTLTNVRNALAHGTRLQAPRRGQSLRDRAMASAVTAVKDPDRLRRELETALNRFFG